MSKLISLATVAALCWVLSLNGVQAEGLSPADQRIQNDVRTLASDEMEGRGPGTEGLRKAADYIAEQFRLVGLNVTGDGGDPFQDFTITHGSLQGKVNRLSFAGPAGKAVGELQAGKDFQACSFGAAGLFSGELVFAGYGLHDEQSNYDDFAGIDVRGKVVIIIRRSPLQASVQSTLARSLARQSALATKLANAAAQGATAVLFVNDPFSVDQKAKELEQKQPQSRDDAPPDAALEATLRDQADALLEFGYGGGKDGRAIPCFQIKQSLADRILVPVLGLSLRELEQEIDSTRQPASKLLPGWTVNGETSVQPQQAPVRNVIAIRDGSGTLKDQTLIIGAHFDHLGRGGQGSLDPTSREIHNGADDNASGTTGLLELARRLGPKPAENSRRILYLAFAGEELGLLGSKHYVEHPLFPLDKTVGMINLDMIGRLEDGRLTVFGAETSPAWDPLLEKANVLSGLLLNRRPEGFGPSDHNTFYTQRIPVLHLFTGTHPDYHRPSDDWEKINVQGVDRIVTLLEGVVSAAAIVPERPPYVQIQGSAVLERAGNRLHFGSVADFSYSGTGYALLDVAPNSPAARAGLLPRDVIVRIDDQPVNSLADFDRVLANVRAGQTVDVRVRRGEQELLLAVSFPRPRN